ncbi:MAG: urease accessory protein UreD [Gammaproteobacteria bacterium]|nr:urease accessory protein UreD [Gammaproteobacteria bacterium]
MALSDARQGAGWQARLELGFSRHGTRTVLTHRLHRGPLMIQRPFYPEGEGCCHVYLLHPPGGVVGGDSLELQVDVEAGARALITVPAAGKFYRSGGAEASQEQHIRVADGAVMEWLPQETIVFDGARLDSLTRVELEAEASFIGWEITCMGRPASGALFHSGSMRQRFELWREGRPLLLDRGHWQGTGKEMQAQWGLSGQPMLGTMMVTGRFDEELDAMREALQAWPGHFALSQLPEVLVCRYLGADAYQARAGFTEIWRRLRPLISGHEVCEPRIWNT